MYKIRDEINNIATHPNLEHLIISCKNRVSILKLDGNLEFIGIDHPLNNITQENIYTIAITPNGKYLTIISNDYSEEKYSITIWEISNGQKVVTISRNYPVHSICFSIDSEFLAIAGRSKIAHVCKIPTGEEIACLPHAYFVNKVSFNPIYNKGYLLATASDIAKFWKLDNALQVSYIKHRDTNKLLKSSSFQGAIFSLDSQYIATLDKEDNTVKVWAIANSQQITCLQYSDLIRILSFTADGKYIFTVGGDNIISITRWKDITNSNSIRLDYKGFIHAMSFSPDNKYLAILLTDKNNHIFCEVHILSLDFDFIRLQFSLDRNSLTWNKFSMKQFTIIPHIGTYQNESIRFSWNENELYLLASYSNSAARIWDVFNTKVIMEVSHETI